MISILGIWKMMYKVLLYKGVFGSVYIRGISLHKVPMIFISDHCNGRHLVSWSSNQYGCTYDNPLIIQFGLGRKLDSLGRLSRRPN